MIGVEIAVGLKNLYALGVGVAQGLLEQETDSGESDAMHNLAAALFNRAIGEIAYLAEWMGGLRETVYSLAGIGDLYVTCQGGRNNRMGQYIGRGYSYQEAKTKYLPEETVEGAELAYAIDDVIRINLGNGKLDASEIALLLYLNDVICRDMTPSLSGIYSTI
jgi:glycerol-3-phosphate dehydrogenase (NAD(P)+)